MIGLIQRVSSASVDIDGKRVAGIGTGILALIGIERHDGKSKAERLLEKMLAYRVFADNEGRMNLSVRQIHGNVLLVPQFTLVADTTRGNRPGFSGGASLQQAHALFTYLADIARLSYPAVQCGQFGADMKVSLLNDGPVTFWLQV